MKPTRRSQLRRFRNFLAMVVAIGTPVTWTLMSIDLPLDQAGSPGSSPLGYSRSLSLFLVPLVFLGWWFLRRCDCPLQRRAFKWSMLVLPVLGFGLDFAFANTFFRFPNHGAVLGECVSANGAPLPWSHASLLCIPARGGLVPVEEFVFYLAGFMVVLLTYIWANEEWLSTYRATDFKSRAAELPALLRFTPGAFVVGGLLILLAFAGREWLAEEELGGFPGYAVFLVLASVVPTVGFFRSVRDFINWSAFATAFFLMLLVSLIWEVTLALPYGWWGYNDEYMIGVFVTAWSRLPVEAIFVWLAVTFTSVVIYEAIRLGLASKKSFRRALLGDRPGR